MSLCFLYASTRKYTNATSHGAAGYVENIDFHNKTCGILKLSKALELNEEKLREEKALD